MKKLFAILSVFLMALSLFVGIAHAYVSQYTSQNYNAVSSQSTSAYVDDGFYGGYGLGGYGLGGYGLGGYGLGGYGLGYGSGYGAYPYSYGLSTPCFGGYGLGGYSYPYGYTSSTSTESVYGLNSAYPFGGLGYGLGGYGLGGYGLGGLGGVPNGYTLSTSSYTPYYGW